MATVLEHASATGILTRAARRSYRALLDIPAIPLLILTVLALVAIFAPVLAPHSKLDPVPPTAAQCQAKYGTPTCPYVEYAPPLWSREGSLATPLGTDFLGRAVRLPGQVVGPGHHAYHRCLAHLALARLRHPPLQRARARPVERGADPRPRLLESLLAGGAGRGPDAAGTRLRAAGRDQRHPQAPDHLPPSRAQRHEHGDGAVQLAGGRGRHHRGLAQLPGRGRAAARALVGSDDGPGARGADGRPLVAGRFPRALHHHARAVRQHAR